MRRLLVPALLAVGCRSSDGPAGASAGSRQPGDNQVAVRVQYTPRDSTPFAAAARFHRCGGTGRGFVLDGTVQGNGILVWLRTPDSTAAGTYQILSRWDTMMARGAVVAIRFVIGDAAHGLALDSGSVVATAARGGVSAQIVGAGLEAEGGRKVHADARFGATAIGPDTLDCAAQL